MTTTAEKIKYFEDRIIEFQQWIEELKAEQPSDPEPLECWVYFQDGQPKSVHPLEIAIAKKMRQVTPQDEQDRKDAARYREAKLRQFSLHGSMRYKWDEIIDKAMETGG